MKLIDYINTKHNGSQVAFANANGFTKQLVWRMLNKGAWHVYDGMLLNHRRDVNELKHNNP